MDDKPRPYRSKATTNRVLVHARVSPEVRATLERAAAVADDGNISAVTERALRAWLAANGWMPEPGVVQIRVTPKTRNSFTIRGLSISGVT